MIKILTVIGTRPEAIKMCPLIMALRERQDVCVKVILSGQHKELSDEVIKDFGIDVDYHFNIMKKDQTLFDITERIMQNMKLTLGYEKPDFLLVHGDTTTAFASALAAFYMKTPVAHVEAGLRTHSPYSPYPEEFNRHAIDIFADLCFAPTVGAKENLLREGVPEDKIFICGNTGIDALFYTLGQKKKNLISKIWQGKRTVVITLHRRETDDGTMKGIMSAIGEVLKNIDNVHAVFPVHPSPRVRTIAEEVFRANESITLTRPLDPIEFHRLMAESYLIVSDSGGIQEEACALGVPLLLVRDTTERPEAAECGNVLLSGTDPDFVASNLKKLLCDAEFHDSMAKKSNIFGDGRASERISSILIEKAASISANDSEKKHK